MNDKKNNSITGKKEESLYQQERLLDAVAYSAKELLSSVEWTSRINEILRRLGEASGSSRVYVFQHDHDQKGNLITSLVFEWCAEGIEAQISNPDLQGMEIANAGFQRWIDLMSTGKSVYGAVDGFPEDERKLLEYQSIKSLVVIPFFVSGKWWGFIGFDQCDRVRDWSKAELGALQAAGSMIGSAIERQTSEQLLQKQFHELQKTNQELDFFVYSVSHDLRAPLASLLGLINLAEMEIPNPNQQEYLTLMRDSVHKLDGFIREILDYSRNTRTRVEHESFDLKGFLEDISRQIIPSDQDILFSIEYLTEPGVVFRSDKKRLWIVFNNLLSNSLRFRDANKSHCRIHLNVRLSSKGAWIKIEDNGIGIEPVHLDKIFNMFYRATEYGTGSGLGLYIVKEVVSKLGGDIKVDSIPKEFTQFELWIPSHQDNQSIEQ